MALPFTPAQAKALISDPTATLCGNFLNTLLKVPIFFYQLVNYIFDSNGNINAPFIRLIRKPGDRIESFAPLAEDGSRLLCDGRDVARTDWPDLFAAIGTTYGSSGSTTFKLPDARARFPLAVGTLPSGASVALGATGGEEKHELAGLEIAHKHLTGRFRPADDEVYLIIQPQITTMTDSLTGQSVDGENAAVATADVQGAPLTGNWTCTSKAVPDGGVNPIRYDPHNTMPPWISCYVYIAT